MTIKTTEGQRREMYWRHLQGESYDVIGKSYGLSRECVRYWCRRQRDGGRVKTQWHRPAPGVLSHSDPIVRYCILRLRLEHPGWGPERIRFHLGRRSSLQNKRLPSRAGIGRYLKQWPRFRHRRRARHQQIRVTPPKPTRVHECWQIDFKLGIELDSGVQVNLHTVRDPVGEACITAQITPAGPVGSHPKRVTEQELQLTLRTAFNHWQTLPEAVQSDNEPVFVGDTGDDFPGRFQLWLTGLGIQHWAIRPGKPTDNAAVERCHQTLYTYVLNGNETLTPTDLQLALEQGLDQLNGQLPSRAANCHGRPPLLAHPELLAQPRPWRPEWELAHFDIRRVHALLASHVWTRRVGKTGQVCIGGHHRYYSVGRQYARQDVLVGFDPDDRCFVFFQIDDQDPSTVGHEIARRPARFLTVEHITGIRQDPACLGPQQLGFVFPDPSRGRLLMSIKG